MSLPARVKIGLYDFAVTWHDDPRDDAGVKLCGQCRFMDETIILRAGMTPRHTLETFMHELLHGIEHAMGIDLGEKRLGRLSLGLTAALVENALLHAALLPPDGGPGHVYAGPPSSACAKEG